MKIAISGASGFIGNNLISKLSMQDNIIPTRLLYSSTKEKGEFDYFGDLLRKDTLSDWIDGADVVVNLAYMWNSPSNLNIDAVDNLFFECERVCVKRLIHISTAAVVGRAKSHYIDENTVCNPYTNYGRTKLNIEHLLLQRAQNSKVDLVILRPTSVFGWGGKPLLKLSKDLLHKYWLINYLRATLFSDRAMNLIHIDNVVAAICFLINYNLPFKGEIFILSEDHDVRNNFEYIENLLRNELKIYDYPLPIYKLPSSFLSLLLRLMRRNIIDTHCRFISDKIRSYGFEPPVNFVDSLKKYAALLRIDMI